MGIVRTQRVKTEIAIACSVLRNVDPFNFRHPWPVPGDMRDQILKSRLFTVFFMFFPVLFPSYRELDL